MVIRIAKDILLVWLALAGLGVASVSLLILYFKVADFFRHFLSRSQNGSVQPDIRSSARSGR